MAMDKKTQYGQDVLFFLHHDLKINVILIKVQKVILQILANFSELYMERQNTQNSQLSIEGEQSQTIDTI